VKIRLAALAIALALFVPLAFASIEDCSCNEDKFSAAVSDEKVFNITGHFALDPETHCRDGVMGGNSIDLVSEAFEHDNLSFRAVCSGLWPDTLKSLDNRSADVVTSMFPTVERNKTYRFFGPSGKDQIGGFLNNESNIEISDIGDLAGIRVVTTNNESWGYLIDYLIEQKLLDVRKVDSPLEAFDWVKEGKADCFLYSIPAGEGIIAEYGLSGFKSTAVIETKNFYAAILRASPYADMMAQALENSSLPELKTDPVFA